MNIIIERPTKNTVLLDKARGICCGYIHKIATRTGEAVSVRVDNNIFAGSASYGNAIEAATHRGKSIPNIIVFDGMLAIARDGDGSECAIVGKLLDGVSRYFHFASTSQIY